MDATNMKQVVEALLIATDTPLPIARITEITQLPEDEIRNIVSILNDEYKSNARAFEIKEIAEGFQIYTLPEFALWIGALLDKKSKLSKAALETIAIIAYHQPITRPEIEKYRGVDSSWVIDTLLQKGLIKTSGRLPVPGRPIRYATTREFLRYFGLKSIDDLPKEEDFEEQLGESVLEEEPVHQQAGSPAPADSVDEETAEEPEETIDSEDDEEPGLDESNNLS